LTDGSKHFNIRKQYRLGGPSGDPYPVRAEEPEHRVIESSRTKPAEISLPPYSLTVIRGGLSSPRIK